MLSMSKMSKIDQIYLRAVMLCASKMSKMSKIDQIHLRTVMLCMSKMSQAETWGFPTIPSNTVYIKACRRCRR